MSIFKPGHVVVYSLWARDVPATVHFYRDVIGLDLLPHHGHHAAFDLGHGSHLVIVRGQPAPAANTAQESFPRIAFAVDDLDGAIAHLKSCQVELQGDVQVTPNARWILFRDPAGNLIEFAQLDAVE
ncbi:MAG: VOC family protein [Anaerolineae bacterium]|nr:VOC family protein [Anaerolineae bacterium]